VAKVKVRIEEDCPECHGAGEVLATIWLFGQPPFLKWTTCPECEGTGTVHSVHEVDEANLEGEDVGE
jgi:DnaJ-class molecular chaperone